MNKYGYPEECPVFACRHRWWPEGEVFEAFGWVDGGSNLIGRWSIDGGRLATEEGGRRFCPGDLRPLTRAARDMLALVTP